jgi:hypothetical protein
MQKSPLGELARFGVTRSGGYERLNHFRRDDTSAMTAKFHNILASVGVRRTVHEGCYLVNGKALCALCLLKCAVQNCMAFCGLNGGFPAKTLVGYGKTARAGKPDDC